VGALETSGTTHLIAQYFVDVGGGLGPVAIVGLVIAAAMALAVGSSCAFLTPIGHQSNLLVMGPGGYEFGDYWRLGLPVSMAVLATGVPAILWIWPA